MKLEGKTIVITGGSMGIGLAVAKRAASEGASLVLVSRHEVDLKKAVAELRADEGQHHDYHAMDVSKRDEVEAFFKTLGNSVQGLVNCAGIYGPIGKTGDVDVVEFENALHINLLGTLFMCRYFIPLLKKSSRGKIVNFAGGGAASAFPYYSAYAVSKVGVVRLTENLAREYKDENLDANAVAPGFVITRLHEETVKAKERTDPEFLKRTLHEMETGGVPAEKAAGLTAFLLSSGSNGITGKFISAAWDSWEKPEFQKKLREDKDLCTLRRIDGKDFVKL